MRRAALLGTLVLAFALAGCATAPTDRLPSPQLTSATTPPLEQLDVATWGQTAFGDKAPDANVKAEIVEPGHAESADISTDSGSWTFQVTCISHSAATVTVKLTTPDATASEQVACVTASGQKPTIVGLPFTGGRKTTVTIESSAEAAFAVRTVAATG